MVTFVKPYVCTDFFLPSEPNNAFSRLSPKYFVLPQFLSLPCCLKMLNSVCCHVHKVDV